jgi:hypothetical protein
MIHINTLSGDRYTTINVSEDDIDYSDLEKYIKTPVHPIYKNWMDVDYDEGTCDLFEILIYTRIHLSYNGVEVETYDKINFDIDHLTVHFTQEYHYFNGEFDDDVHEFVVLDNQLEMIDDQTEKICEEFIRKDPFNIIFVKDKTENLCCCAVKLNGFVLRYIPPEMTTDGICFIAVYYNNDAFKVIPDEKKDINMCSHCVLYNGYLLKYVPHNMKTAEICNVAFNNNIHAIMYIPDELKTEKMCKEAVKINGLMLEYVPHNIKTAEICNDAFDNDRNAVRYIPDELKTASFISKKN